MNEQINEVYYNMDKSVESMVEGRIYQGVSYQQYVLTAANNLADFLANILDNMQQSMKAGSGSSGQGSDFQLPDIIKGQQELGEKMGEKPGCGLMKPPIISTCWTKQSTAEMSLKQVIRDKVASEIVRRDARLDPGRRTSPESPSETSLSERSSV